ncbi:MAG TPA: thioredoxin [Chloroflexota bacterium]|nr:thioredoxin [Chloroflexota bacterium]
MSSSPAVTDASFQKDVLQAGEPVLVDFWATWCQPCRMVAPIVEEIAGEQAGKMKVMKLDVDENQQTAMQYGVSSIPTLILFKGGEPVERVVGFNPKERLLSKLTPHLN